MTHVGEFSDEEEVQRATGYIGGWVEWWWEESKELFWGQFFYKQLRHYKRDSSKYEWETEGMKK